jgi:hypothetical protein
VTDFFAPGRKYFSHRIARHQFAPRGGHYWRNNLFFQRLRQVGLNVVETLGINLVTYGDGEAKGESFFRLDA